MSYNIGPKIGIDGEKEFRKSIKNINDTYKALQAETKAVTAAFDAQGDEQGKLESASKLLQKQIDKQKEKMDLLSDAVSKATDKFGEDSVEATRLRGALYDTQTTIANLESELKDTRSQLTQAGDAMESFEDNTENAGNTAIDFGDVLKANLVSDLILDGLREMASLVKDFAVGSIESAAEVQAATAQFEQTFKSVESAASDSLESISDDTNIASTRMQGSFSTIYAFAKNAGAGATEALSISSRAMIVAADNAAYYDKSIEDATEQLQSFLKGNYANDAALGIAATETTRNAKANQLYAKSFQELSESQKVDVLLAMVEAGNEASGAIGQAARESDSWGNVTGELAEVMRLLQAEAGKPALKKLVPIIKNITKAGYELIDDIDWDEFGETVENIADSVIDHGPGVVKAIAAVATGIVAFKITQKVAEFASLAKSLIGIGTAAQTAGTAVAASGAVAAASPWGLVALAIGGVVSAITIAAMETANAQSDLEKATDNLVESIAKADEAYQDTKSEIEGAAYTAEHYVKRLQELETAGLNTAVAHREYALIVEQLNELIPELNLEIDEQTGLLKTDTEALAANIEAWKNDATAKALYAKNTDVFKAYGEATSKLIDAEAQLNILQKDSVVNEERLGNAREERQRTGEKLRYNESRLADTYGMTEEELRDLIRETDELRRQEQDLYTEIENLETAQRINANTQDGLNKKISDANELVASYDGEIAQIQASIDLFNQKTSEATAETRLLTEAELQVKDALYNLALEFSEAEIAAMESINTQVGLFDELTAKSDWSAEKIIQNWESQRLAFDNYSANLQKAVDMGLDQTLVQQLSDGSTESMQILDALVNDTDIDIDEINASFARTSESKEQLATTMAAVQTDFGDRMDQLVQDAEDAGLEIPAGLASGVKGSAYQFIDEVISMATAGINWFEEIFDINSPSRVMEMEAEYIVGGAANSIDKNAADFERSMADLASCGYDAFLEERLDRAVSYPDMVTAASTVTTSRIAHNYGGLNFQIYQRDGESAEDLACRVMDIINSEVASKEAVF